MKDRQKYKMFNTNFNAIHLDFIIIHFYAAYNFLFEKNQDLRENTTSNLIDLWDSRMYYQIFKS